MKARNLSIGNPESGINFAVEEPKIAEAEVGGNHRSFVEHRLTQ